MQKQKLKYCISGHGNAIAACRGWCAHVKNMCWLTHHYICSCWWGDHCNHYKNHSRLSVHHWIRSAIHASQQLTSPITSYHILSLKLPPPPCAVPLVYLYMLICLNMYIYIYIYSYIFIYVYTLYVLGMGLVENRVPAVVWQDLTTTIFTIFIGINFFLGKPWKTHIPGYHIFKHTHVRMKI